MLCWGRGIIPVQNEVCSVFFCLFVLVCTRN